MLSSTLTWSGVFGAVVNGEYDFSLCYWTPFIYRVPFVDYFYSRDVKVVVNR